MSTWIPLSQRRPLPRQRIDVWVVPPGAHLAKYPNLRPYRVVDLIVAEDGRFSAGSHGPYQYNVTHWMPTPTAP